MGQNTEKADKFTAGGLRFRLKDHSLPAPPRRRKISVPELGPMTTVHESSMDSRRSCQTGILCSSQTQLTLFQATIPGRPVFHERSASAPGNNWKHLNFTFKTSYASKPEATTSSIARPPVSPKDLPPLVIPAHMSSSPSPLKRQLSLSRTRSRNTSKDGPRSSARPEDSPKSRTPYTPGPPSATTSISTTPGSATYSSMSASSLATPVSAFPTESHGGDFPKSWRTDSLTPTSDTATPEISAPISAVESRSSSRTEGHRRMASDSSTIAGSIMERGRPKKPSEGLKRSDSKKNKSAERRAFETLPKGWKVPEAVKMLDTAETVALNKQALQQAERFEVLRKCDVDVLSRVSELSADSTHIYVRQPHANLRLRRNSATWMSAVNISAAPTTR